MTFNIPLNARNAMLDRMKLSLPMVTASSSVSPGHLVDELKQRARGSRWPPIKFSSAGAKVSIDFEPKNWLFDLSIKLRFGDGRWSGAGSLELNGMRLFGYLSARRDPLDDRNIYPTDLVRPEGQRVHPGTLDGKDNFIASTYMPDALARGWPDFCQRYVEAIVEVFDDVFNSSAGPQKIHSPLLVFPSFGEWVWREVEVCHEYGEDDAVSIAEKFKELTLILGTDHRNSSYFNRSGLLQKENKSSNLYTSSTNLTKNIDLVCYAKAVDRFRVEVRYRPSILKSCRLSRSELPTTSRVVSTVLAALCEDGTRRMNKAVRDCLARMEGCSPNMRSISVVLALVAGACGNDSTLIQRFVSAFIQGQGIAPFPGSEEAIDALIAASVLVRSKMKLRSPQPQYVLDERFRSSFGTLRIALANASVGEPDL